MNLGLVSVGVIVWQVAGVHIGSRAADCVVTNRRFSGTEVRYLFKTIEESYSSLILPALVSDLFLAPFQPSDLSTWCKSRGSKIAFFPIVQMATRK